MVRNLSQLCYKALMMTSRLVIFITCSSVAMTVIASCLLNDNQLDSFTNIIWFMTKILLYLSVTVGSFLLGAASKRIEEERLRRIFEQRRRVFETANESWSEHRERLRFVEELERELMTRSSEASKISGGLPMFIGPTRKTRACRLNARPWSTDSRCWAATTMMESTKRRNHCRSPGRKPGPAPREKRPAYSTSRWEAPRTTRVLGCAASRSMPPTGVFKWNGRFQPPAVLNMSESTSLWPADFNTTS